MHSNLLVVSLIWNLVEVCLWNVWPGSSSPGEEWLWQFRQDQTQDDALMDTMTPWCSDGVNNNLISLSAWVMVTLHYEKVSSWHLTLPPASTANNNYFVIGMGHYLDCVTAICTTENFNVQLSLFEHITTYLVLEVHNHRPVLVIIDNFLDNSVWRAGIINQLSFTLHLFSYYTGAD